MSAANPAAGATPGASGRRTVPLREVAHARAGDKGDVSSVAVFAFEPRHYPALKAQLTPERLKAEFGGVFRGPIRRYELDGLHGLNFVMESGLEGGVNTSLNLDGHGKSWSFLLLSLEVEVEVDAEVDAEVNAKAEP